MQESPVDSSHIYELIKGALTDDINNREIFMKGIDYSYYYEQVDWFVSIIYNVRALKRNILGKSYGSILLDSIYCANIVYPSWIRLIEILKMQRFLKSIKRS